MVVRAIAAHRCGLGPSPSFDAICRWHLLWAFFFAPRGFLGYSGFQKPYIIREIPYDGLAFSIHGCFMKQEPNKMVILRLLDPIKGRGIGNAAK